MTFDTLLNHYRTHAFSEHDKGRRFEHLMQAYLKTDPKYAHLFAHVWLWSEFPFRGDFGGADTGIDLVAKTVDGDYWAIQCKCYVASATIDKPAVDSFLATSSREFRDEDRRPTRFAQRLWISTTNNWGPNATEAIKNQNPPVTRLGLFDLQEAPVDWEKLETGIHGAQSRRAKKTIRPHQKQAVDLAHTYFKSADRGKLIMACGTGKTYVSLRIAEHETNGRGFILFLVPSIALLGQTLREWSADAQENINAICICSDPEISKTKQKTADADLTSVVDLALPASTNVDAIVAQFDALRANDDAHTGMTVVFSTYQSIDVIAQAQRRLLQNGSPFGPFDLIICDEAHRTTGVTLADQDESAFVKVHKNDFLRAAKRLYMTATPRLYSDDTKSKADQADAVLCSMDDPALYGDEIYRIGFGEAVDRGLLTDYKVLILTLNESDIPPAVQNMIADKSSEINTDDASKLIGCINALSKHILGDNGVLRATDPDPMRRAVAFCQTIPVSKRITTTFNTTTDVYLNDLPAADRDALIPVAAQHVDGTMSAPKRDELLAWLKAEPDTPECRILTNVRCLSEGVDVPSLDAVLFLSARNSQVDVVQSVGRVMRKSPGKNYGYIIIPIIVPSDMDPNHALDNNERYKVVWTVLNALRAHDDRFNATINKIELNHQRPGTKPDDRILVATIGRGGDDDSGDGSPDDAAARAQQKLAQQLALQFPELQSAIFAKMVQKVGDKHYWEQWAKDVADIADRQVDRIRRLSQEDGPHRAAFASFLSGLRANINPSISAHDAIEMLSQHVITKPVFDALFENYSFAQHNPISTAMQAMLDLLEAQAVAKDTVTLDRFYASVRKRVAGIDNAAARQRIIIELYDKFFKTAFPTMVERLGIVYTPVELVDFMLRSVDDVLRQEFGRGLTDDNVHILDPFTGTGTFITRLLQSGLIQPADLERKYTEELHANEIVLLAYYIAAINIENAYHDAAGAPDQYRSFDGIVLTDTFQLGETGTAQRPSFGGDIAAAMFAQNSDRVQRQMHAPLRVILGNPPYSIGQKSANDNAQNQSYPDLDARIAATYAAASTAVLSKSLYDAYIKAFRWASDRLDPQHGGIICFVSNAGWLDGSSQDGFRKCLEQEFSAIYVFNLRGNQRTSGELSRREGGKIFGSGSRTPIAITLLVKKPAHPAAPATIRYHDIGDYLTRDQKLTILRDAQSISASSISWHTLQPNAHGDWLAQRNDAFSSFIPLAPDKKFDPQAQSFFITHAVGVVTSRDAWAYNYSAPALAANMRRMIAFYNQQQQDYAQARIANPDLTADQCIDTDPTQINWSVNLKTALSRGDTFVFNDRHLRPSLYRPFSKQHLYLDRTFIERPGLNAQLFPTPTLPNRTICTSSKATEGLKVLAADAIADFNFTGETQAFPLFYYEEREKKSPTLFDSANEPEYTRRDAISDFIHRRARAQYGAAVTKEDIFYYVYGLLHSPTYRATFAVDLTKSLPRLPLVAAAADFWAFSQAGRALADLHLHYENVPPHPDVIVTGAESGDFRVEKMRHPVKGQTDTILYNSHITLSGIPAAAYDYIVNGKSAIAWVMERYQVTTHKESRIVNDPNTWADENGNPRYILDLLLSVIHVSTQTVALVDSLPKLTFAGET